MEAHARAPDPLTKDGDMASNWQSWKEDFIIFMKVTGYIDKSNEIRSNLLKNRIGKVGIEAIQNISFDNIQDKDDMDILIKKLEEYFNPPKKEVVERYQFFSRAKKQNESIEQYINVLKEKAKTCNFNDMTDSIIRDKIVLDTHDKILRKKFFEADNLDLLKLVAIYNDYNINTEKMKQITEENKAESTSFPQKLPDNNLKRCCWRCGRQHPQGKCPAWGSKCTKCNDVNHFTHCCKGPNFRMNNKVNKNLLDPTQQTKFTPKKNDKWNNQTDSAVKTKDSMNKMTDLPDIPTTSCNDTNSAVCNDSSDFVILNIPNKNSKLYYNDTTNHSAHLPKNTQYNYSYEYMEVKPDGTVTDLYKGEDIQPKQMKKAFVSTAQVQPTDYSYTEVKPDGTVTDLYNKGQNIQSKQMKKAFVNAQVQPTNSYTEVKPDGTVTDLYNKGQNIQPKQMKNAFVNTAQVQPTNSYTKVKPDGTVTELYNKGQNVQPKQMKKAFVNTAHVQPTDYSYTDVKPDRTVTDLYKGQNIQPKQMKQAFVNAQVQPNDSYTEVKPDGTVTDLYNKAQNIQPKQMKKAFVNTAQVQSTDYSYTEVKPDGTVTDLYNKGQNIQPKQVQKKTFVNTAQVHLTDHSYTEVKLDRPVIDPWSYSDLYNKRENIQPKQTKVHAVNAAPTNFSHVLKPASHNTQKIKNDRKKKSDEDTCILS